MSLFRQSMLKGKRRWYQYSLRSLMVCISLCACLLGLLRWYYLARGWYPTVSEMVVVTQCERKDNYIRCEFRMDRRFIVEFNHVLEMKQSDGSLDKKFEHIASINSTHDLIRGHVVEFKIIPGRAVIIKSNEHSYDVCGWSTSDGEKTIIDIGEGLYFREGCYLSLAYLNADRTESIEIGANCPVQKPCSDKSKSGDYHGTGNPETNYPLRQNK